MICSPFQVFIKLSITDFIARFLNATPTKAFEKVLKNKYFSFSFLTKVYLNNFNIITSY